MPIECEFKWKARTQEDFSRMLQVVREHFPGLVNGPLAVLNEDFYLDTPQGVWSAHNTALRLRCANGRFEATAKSQTKMVDGKAVRKEETLPLPAAANITQALKMLQGKGAWLGFPVEKLEIVFTITNHRRIYNLTDANAVYELAFDDCILSVSGRQIELKEIELELKTGDEKIFSSFAGVLKQKSGLNAPEKSKVESARALLEDEKK